MFQISLIRTDGVSESIEFSLYCKGKPVSCLSSYNEPTYCIAKGSLIRILLKSKQSKLLVCSGSFNTEVFPKEGFQWVPMSTSPQDLFSKLPEEVNPPRLLILISSDILSPVVESSEAESEDCDTYKTNTNKTHDTHKINSDDIDTNKMIKDKNDEILIENLKLKENLSLLNAENEKNKFFAGKFEELYTQCKKEFDDIKALHENEKNKNAELLETIKKLNDEIESTKINAKMREEFLEGLLSYREQSHNRKSVENKEIDSTQDLDNNKTTATPVINTKSYPRHSFNLKSNKSGEGIDMYRKQEPKRRVLSEINFNNEKQNTCTALNEYMKKNKKNGAFKKESGNIYQYGKKKVFITLKNGNLLCRVGGGFENIDKFVAKNPETRILSCPDPSKKLNKIPAKKLQKKQKPKSMNFADLDCTENYFGKGSNPEYYETE
jgi:Growth-Arrest-Specific Protein 2 Domain